MKLFDNVAGEDKTLITVVALIVIALITIMFSIRSCHLEETQKYLSAGCEQVYVPGRTEAIWSNCKKSLENVK